MAVVFWMHSKVYGSKHDLRTSNLEEEGQGNTEQIYSTQNSLQNRFHTQECIAYIIMQIHTTIVMKVVA